MQPDQQKRILGYFIEEAKEHLQTIETSLLDLQGVVDNSEMLDEVFRAAHSVKGGAAMLGIYSIQHTAHKLEDYFKVLKEHPVQVDQKLEALFLQGFDILNELLEELQGPFGLGDEVSEAALRQGEPIFAQLQSHLNLLTGEAPAEAVVTPTPEPVPAPAPAIAPLLQPFQSDVPQQLRQMLDLFKQEDTPAQRQQLGEICRNLAQLGGGELPTWTSLLQLCQQVIANPANALIDLATVVLREIKTARDQVLADQATLLSPSPELTALAAASTKTVAPLDELIPSPWEDPLTPSEEAALPGEQSATNSSEDITELLLADLREPLLDNDAAADLARFFGEDAQLEPVAETPTEMNLDRLFEEDLLTETGGAVGASPSPQDRPTALSPAPKIDESSISTSGNLDVPGAGDDNIPAMADFATLAAFLAETEPVAQPIAQAADFQDLEQLLEESNRSLANTSTPASRSFAPRSRSARRATTGFEQTMKVPVKHLDTLNNLVGELVVNRNSLEDNQEKLRQFLDNLLYQVQQLTEVSQQMQELYERSLLENSLLATSNPRMGLVTTGAEPTANGHATGASFDALEMDRFTGFHSLSQEIIERIVRVREAASDIEFVVDGTEQVTRTFRQVTTQVQEGLSRSRMIPFAQIADRLPRAVRDLSLKCGKQARLEIEGRDTLVDKGILERLYDPLTHLVNNAIYHGIEPPHVRQSLGKPPEGTIKVRAFYQGSQTIISVSDDGGGIDIERVKTKAVQQGLITQADCETLSRQDIYSFLFRSGFSTQDHADELAGRGVGMDVVRASLEEIRGAINTDSTAGKGTSFTVRLPLTLSITKALCCVDNHCRIAFPIDGVEDMVDVEQEQVQQLDQERLFSWRDQLLPFRRLSELLPYQRQISRGSVYGGSNQDENVISVVVLRSGDDLMAVQVDQVLGEQEIVIKQLIGPVPKALGIAGVTVQGDGRVMPIADILELIDISLGRLEVNRSLWGTSLPQESEPTKTEPLVLIVDDSITVRELLSMTFNKVGYRVEQARDGQEAWEKLRSGLPCDLVFCDIEMPRMDGLELLSRIQKDSNLNHLPIAMLTSRGAERHRQMAVQLGAKGYFTKPYLEEALLDAANRLLQGEVLVAQTVRGGSDVE